MKNTLLLCALLLLLSPGFPVSYGHETETKNTATPVLVLNSKQDPRKTIAVYGKPLQKINSTKVLISDFSVVDCSSNQELARFSDEVCTVELRYNKIFVNTLPPEDEEQFEGKVIYFKGEKIMVRSIVKIASAANNTDFIKKLLTPNPE